MSVLISQESHSNSIYHLHTQDPNATHLTLLSMSTISHLVKVCLSICFINVFNKDVRPLFVFLKHSIFTFSTAVDATTITDQVETDKKTPFCFAVSCILLQVSKWVAKTLPQRNPSSLLQKQ